MLNTLNRKMDIERLRNSTYDLIIIGGGITGAGIALDAAKRGMSVALIEMRDFASGTSSRSTKLVHGGLRYLKQFQVNVVRKTGIEREIVYENGPHVTRPEKMLLPIYKTGTFSKLSTSIGLKVYDSLAKVNKNDRRKMLSSKEVEQLVPILRQEGLLGGGLYVEYKTDDARLTIEVMKKAREYGADILNYASAEDFIFEKEQIKGVNVKDRVNDLSFKINGKIVVNATGPWVQGLLKKDIYELKDKALVHTKGVHIVIDAGKFPLDQAIYFDNEKDGRMIFAIPRDGKTYIGTTDTFYNGPLEEPEVSPEDKEYLVDTTNVMFPNLNISVEDIESSWAGIRPLIKDKNKSASDISRKDEIWESKSGLITIAGGKLTGYRSMAETIVNLVSDRMEKNYSISFNKCSTKTETISGGDVGGGKGFPNFIIQNMDIAIKKGMEESEAEYIVTKYGSNVNRIINIYEELDDSSTLSKLLRSELIYCIENEMVVKPEDFLVRRTGYTYFNREKVDSIYKDVVEYMSQILDWDEMTTQNYQGKPTL